MTARGVLVKKPSKRTPLGNAMTPKCRQNFLNSPEMTVPSGRWMVPSPSPGWAFQATVIKLFGEDLPECEP